MPNLLQYVSNGDHYGRIKGKGKLIHECLKTDVWTTAKLRLHDFLKKQKEEGDQIKAPKFTEAVAWFKQELDGSSALKPQSKQYLLWRLQKWETSWPEVLELRLAEMNGESLGAQATGNRGTQWPHSQNCALQRGVEAGVQRDGQQAPDSPRPSALGRDYLY